MKIVAVNFNFVAVNFNFVAVFFYKKVYIYNKICIFVAVVVVKFNKFSLEKFFSKI
jgi:hypothetical protein